MRTWIASAVVLACLGTVVTGTLDAAGLTPPSSAKILADARSLSGTGRRVTLGPNDVDFDSSKCTLTVRPSGVLPRRELSGVIPATELLSLGTPTYTYFAHGDVSYCLASQDWRRGEYSRGEVNRTDVLYSAADGSDRPLMAVSSWAYGYDPLATIDAIQAGGAGSVILTYLSCGPLWKSPEVRCTSTIIDYSPSDSQVSVALCFPNALEGLPALADNIEVCPVAEPSPPNQITLELRLYATARLLQCESYPTLFEELVERVGYTLDKVAEWKSWMSDSTQPVTVAIMLTNPRDTIAEAKQADAQFKSYSAKVHQELMDWAHDSASAARIVHRAQATWTKRRRAEVEGTVTVAYELRTGQYTPLTPSDDMFAWFNRRLRASRAIKDSLCVQMRDEWSRLARHRPPRE